MKRPDQAVTQQVNSEPGAALSAFLAGLDFKALPEAVVARTEDLFLDGFASTLAGKDARPVQALEQFTARVGPASGLSEDLTTRGRTTPFVRDFLPKP